MEEQGLVSVSREHLVFAYYVTGHGFGHATRVVEVKYLMNLSFHLLFRPYFFKFQSYSSEILKMKSAVVRLKTFDHLMGMIQLVWFS